MGGWGARVDGEGEVWVDGELEWMGRVRCGWMGS